MRRLLAAILLLPVQFALADGHALPDAVAADPVHYSVEFENDSIRVLRIRYGAGETSTMHTHPANCAIYLTDGSVKMQMASGDTVDADHSVGNVTCADAEAHLPTNTGGSATELILVEMKGRETL